MKIKTKLIISFCIVIFIPINLACVTFAGISKIQTRAIEKKYGVENADVYYMNNSVQILKELTDDHYAEFINLSKNNPEQFINKEYLRTVNKSLKENMSYLIVRVEDDMVFNGGISNDSLVDNLHKNKMEEDKPVGTQYLMSSENALVKQVNFALLDGRYGATYIVTTIDDVIPEVRKMITDIIVSVVLILVVTAIMMSGWVYGSIITPIRKLQTAAENIKEGNLDFTVDVSGEDEIGELGVTFEQMRQRLKINSEEIIHNEKESKALISNIAHDLKTPITAVKGYSEGIIDGVANTPEKVEKYVRTIYNKANEMDTLINELTLYSKIDTNRIPYNFAKINVKDYIADCVDEIGMDLEAKNMELTYHNSAADDINIIADPEQLRRVINNIVGNSVKYMNHPKGKIEIRVKDVGDFIQFEIEDNGKGIAQKDIPYIFDRFYRADTSRNSATGGSGIGLSIVKKIIEDHGGKIWATSKENTGTIMYFVIRKYQEVINE